MESAWGRGGSRCAEGGGGLLGECALVLVIAVALMLVRALYDGLRD